MTDREMMAQIDAKEQVARSNPGKAVRICAGFYFYFAPVIGLCEINHIQAQYDDTDWSGWVSKSAKGSWVNDPRATLSECLSDLSYQSQGDN